MIIWPYFLGELDYFVALIFNNIILFLYGEEIIKRIIDSLEGRIINKYILFVLLVLILIPSIAICIASLIINIPDVILRWVVIFGLVITSYFGFKKKILHK